MSSLPKKYCKKCGRRISWKSNILICGSCWVPICCICVKEKNDSPDGVETDDEGIPWSYCRACDFWTEHEPDYEVEKED